MTKPVKLRDFEPEADNIRDEVLQGLRKEPKELPPKFFYDERGARLFERITELDEYYPTRTEEKIMRENIDEIVDAIGAESMLIEYGSGVSKKTRILLDHMMDPAAYVPIDISKEQLVESAAETNAAYPEIEVLPVRADYEDDSFVIPKPGNSVARRVIYFPGSTIGNFHPPEAARFLKRFARVCGPGGGLLIGVDLVKDREILERAYNDRDGVTAAFNMNMLMRFNRELGTNFKKDEFRHHAFYNESKGRIEMHLVSLTDQTVRLDDEEIHFKKGESIWTESSYKYTLDGFKALASGSGFDVVKVWTDEKQFFSVQYLTA